MNIMQAKRICELFGYKGEFSISHDNIIIKLEDNTKVIKKAEYGLERLLFINELKEHTYNNGFEFIDRFYKYDSDNFYIEVNNEIYYVCNWVNEKEIFINGDEKINITMEVLAKLHNAMNGFVVSSEVKTKNEIGKLPSLLKKRTDELIKLKKVAQNTRGKFDYLYLKNCDFYINEALNCLNDINSDTYLSVEKNAFYNKEICHRDFTYYNMFFINKGAYIMNFDYACYEMNVYDISSFLRKVLSENNWDMEFLENLLQIYSNIKNISDDEMKIIKVLVKFPQRFWRVVNRYYNSRRTCPDNGYYLKLEEVYSQKEDYEKFCLL